MREKKQHRHILLPVLILAAAAAVIACLVLIKHTEKGKLILVGDSRTVGMYWAVTGDFGSEDICVTDDNGNLWSAKSGMGLSWMEETGMPQAEEQMQGGDSLVILMGVNDIAGNATAQDYLDYFREKAADWQEHGVSVYYCSVTPVRKDPGNGITNEKIDAWNETIRDGLPDSITYLDTASIINGIIDFADDLHYEYSTYRTIFEAIKEGVQS